MDLYGLTSDKYASYWEMVNGYRDHTLYSAYQALGETGIDEVSYETGARCLTMRVPANLRRISAT